MNRYWWQQKEDIQDSFMNLEFHRKKHPNSQILSKFIKEQQKFYDEFVFLTNRFSTLGTETREVERFLVRVRDGKTKYNGKRTFVEYQGKQEFLNILWNAEQAFFIPRDVMLEIEAEEASAPIFTPLEGEQLKF